MILVSPTSQEVGVLWLGPGGYSLRGILQACSFEMIVQALIVALSPHFPGTVTQDLINGSHVFILTLFCICIVFIKWLITVYLKAKELLNKRVLMGVEIKK